MKTHIVISSLSSWRRRASLLASVVALVAVNTVHLSAHETAGPNPCPCPDLLPQTVLQLESARQAAGRFFDVQAAIAAGYVDIGLYVPHMGWHFLNPKLLDARFDPKEPEILVYQEEVDGKLRLAAVEYAVPVELSAKAPQGFVGDEDVWYYNTQFQLWTLHTWVYDYNPDGVFAAMNMRLP